LNLNDITINDITINDIEPQHAKELFEIYSDPKVCEYFDIPPVKTSIETLDQIRNWIRLRSEKKQLRFGIFYNNKLIGTCGIYSIYWHQNRASLGYDLNSKYWNMGITTFALTKLLTVLKNEYNIHRIQATLLKNNFASVKVLTKLGFEYEGTLKDYERWKGEYVNLEMYSKIL